MHYELYVELMFYPYYLDAEALQRLAVILSVLQVANVMLAQVMSVLQQPAYKHSLVLQGMRDLLQETVTAAAPAAATAHNSSQRDRQHTHGALLSQCEALCVPVVY
jgi:hypothetical protein